MALSLGTKLGPYEIVAPLGAGGMGEVYRARDTRLNRDVAISETIEELERENAKLKRLVAELSLEKQILKDVAEGNF